MASSRHSICICFAVICVDCTVYLNFSAYSKPFFWLLALVSKYLQTKFCEEFHLFAFPVIYTATDTAFSTVNTLCMVYITKGILPIKISASVIHYRD